MLRTPNELQTSITLRTGWYSGTLPQCVRYLTVGDHHDTQRYNKQYNVEKNSVHFLAGCILPDLYTNVIILIIVIVIANSVP